MDNVYAAIAEALGVAFPAATLLNCRKVLKKAVQWWIPELSVLKAYFCQQPRKKRRRSAQHEAEFQREGVAFSQAMRTAKQELV